VKCLPDSSGGGREIEDRVGGGEGGGGGGRDGEGRPVGRVERGGEGGGELGKVKGPDRWGGRGRGGGWGAVCPGEGWAVHSHLPRFVNGKKLFCELGSEKPDRQGRGAWEKKRELRWPGLREGIDPKREKKGKTSRRCEKPIWSGEPNSKGPSTRSWKIKRGKSVSVSRTCGGQGGGDKKECVNEGRLETVRGNGAQRGGAQGKRGTPEPKQGGGGKRDWGGKWVIYAGGGGGKRKPGPEWEARQKFRGLEEMTEQGCRRKGKTEGWEYHIKKEREKGYFKGTDA